jgi:Predicted membrane protein (DUF2306)
VRAWNVHFDQQTSAFHSSNTVVAVIDDALVDPIHVVEDCIEELVTEHRMRLGVITMALLPALVTLYSFRFFGVFDGVWVGVDPGMRDVIVADPVGALSHTLVTPVALLLGPFQFIPRLRESHRSVHRWTGRVYVAACVIAGFAGRATAFHASGGPEAGWGFGVLAVLWIVTTIPRTERRRSSRCAEG